MSIISELTRHQPIMRDCMVRPGFNVDKFLEKTINIGGMRIGIPFDRNNADIKHIAAKFAEFSRTTSPQKANEALKQILDKLNPCDRGRLMRTLDCLPASQTKFSAKEFVDKCKSQMPFGPIGGRIDIGKLANAYNQMARGDKTGFPRQALAEIMQQLTPCQQIELSAAINRPRCW